MKKIILITILSLVLFSINSIAQFNPRMENENYMVTKLYDSFNSSQLNSGVWNVSSHEIRKDKYDVDLFIWVDSTATVSQSGGDLKLSMLHYPNYTTTDWDGYTITANFIAGEVQTKEYFTYGVYECNATFAYQKGSFPAFWSMSNEDCNAGIPNNEIDIVELKYEESNPTIDDGMFYYPLPCYSGHVGYGATDTSFTWGGTHTFKCIWKPSKIEFWVDNTKLNTVLNNGDYRYPQYDQRVILSQQITIYIPNRKNPPIYGIITPQTSNFHWVKVREFFLAPEITCPSVICSSGTAIMDVDPDATNITWSLSPGYLFSGAITGSGTSATITPSGSSHGLGKITFNFDMPSGESFSAEKEFRVNGPGYDDISFDVYKSDGTPATNMSGHWLMCPNTTYHIYVDNDGPCSTSNYNWTIPSAWTKFYTYQNMISVNTNSSPGGPVSVDATTCCNNEVTIITDYMGTDYNCGYYYMTFTPNPATNETILTLETTSEEKVFDENLEWEIEIYDQTQLLKERITKLKGKEYTLKTTTLKEGVYFVRVKIEKEIVLGKLMIK